MREITLLQLHCRETEDWVGSDHVQLEVTIDGDTTRRLRRRMTDGDRWNLNKRYRFTDSINLRLIERDAADPNDLLGENKVSASDLGATKHKFNRDDADYRLRVHVKDIPGAENSGSTQRLAINLARRFVREDGDGAWRHINRVEMGRAIIDRIQTPDGMNQGRTPLCGPAAITYKLAERDPELYAKMCISLWETGKAELRDGTSVQPSDDTRNSRVGHGMTAADWVINASLRDAENIILDVQGEDQTTALAQAAGITTPWEMAEWAKRVLGLSNTDVHTTFMYGEEDALQAAHRAVSDGGVGFLMVHKALLSNRSPGFDHPNHWVTYEGNLSIDEGLWYVWDSGHYRFDVWTWGEDNVRRIDVDEGTFEDGFWGAVTAT